MHWITLCIFQTFGIGFVLGFWFSALLPPCPRVDFYYMKRIQHADGSVSLVNRSNYFRHTPGNEYAMTSYLCVDEEGLPVMRRCLGNGQWEPLGNISCQQHSKLSEHLFNMDLFLNAKSSYRKEERPDPYHIMNNVSEAVLNFMEPLQPVDVVFIARIIETVTKSQPNLTVSTDIISVYNHLMTTSNRVLQIASRFNATRKLLQNFEEFTNKLAPPSCNKPEEFHSPISVLDVKYAAGLLLLIGEKISVIHLNPQCNNYTGVAIFNSNGPDRQKCKHHGYWYRLLQPTQILLDLKQEEGLIAATYLNEELWQALRDKGATYLVFKVYTNNAFFFDVSSPQEKATPISNVLSLNVLGVQNSVLQSLPHYLTFLLHHKKESPTDVSNDYCGYWSHGKWARKGVTKNSWSTDSLAICETTHLTAFAFLMGGSCKQTNYSTDETLLNTITTVGCWLSCVGAVGIWLTALLCKRWRSKPSTKLLIHLSLAMALLYGLLLLLDFNEMWWHYQFVQGDIACTIMGTIFQYAVLLLFSWMLLIGHLQYQRHVQLVVARSDWTIPKVIVIAWTLPLLPTLLLVSIDHASYRPLPYASDRSVCYPSGNGLDYGVLLPIGLVLISNSYAFGRIFYRISNLENRNIQDVWRQMRLFVLLFFLLGLTWIFGLGTYAQLGYVFNFLFCSTATIQGFVLFVFFVLLDSVSRNFWIQLICRTRRNDNI